MSEKKLPYSKVREHNGVCYVSGQLPIDPETGEMPTSVDAQAAISLANIELALKECGLDRSHVVKTTVLLRNFEDFASVNEVYRNFFGDPYPARSAFGTTGLAAGALVEIEAIAAR